jgi:hypothetical protein
VSNRGDDFYRRIDRIEVAKRDDAMRATQAERERCLEWMRCLVDIGGDIAYGELEAVIVSGEEPPKERE